LKLLTTFRPVVTSLLLCLALLLGGWVARVSLTRGEQTDPVVEPAAVSARLSQIAASGELPSLRWPNFTAYRSQLLQFYEASSFNPVWLEGAQPTAQALSLIQEFELSRRKGLIPDDYDAGRWGARLEELRTTHTPDVLAGFDIALTVSAMRYIADLHVGRVKPATLDFGIELRQKEYDLAQFLTEKVVHVSNVSAALAEIEPPYDGYKRTEAALDHYLQLAAEGDGPPVPQVKKTVAPGDVYAGNAELAQRLELLGDLPASAEAQALPERYSGPLVEAVEHFQARHGLTVDGKLGQQTIRELNVPLARRVRQLEDSLERWRWLPPSFPQPPIVVNIPEFVLRVIGPNHKVVLAMKVVVGKAVRTETPVFAADMRFIVFRPYWNVPRSILRKELIPAIVRDRNYIAANGFEVTEQSGRVVTSGRISDAVLAELRAGGLTLRQVPGPKNALGLIKFLFPNEHDVYLHSTPATNLFSRSRRDFSHGCIRLQEPVELAVWLLRNQTTDQQQPWTAEEVQAAMESGPNNRWVNLATPVPVLILYVTAVVEEDGSIHFFDDIYGHDQSLEAELTQGRPYRKPPVIR
jgi:L,D-transpeptidase YcbB